MLINYCIRCTRFHLICYGHNLFPNVLYSWGKFFTKPSAKHDFQSDKFSNNEETKLVKKECCQLYLVLALAAVNLHGHHLAYTQVT